MARKSGRPLSLRFFNRLPGFCEAYKETDGVLEDISPASLPVKSCGWWNLKSACGGWGEDGCAVVESIVSVISVLAAASEDGSSSNSGSWSAPNSSSI